MKSENRHIVVKPKQRQPGAGILLIAALCVIVTLTGCGGSPRGTPADIDYKAVFLDDGQALFGRLEDSGPSYITLKDVLYVPRRMYDNRSITNVGAVIGPAWQGSDPIRLDSRHIVALIDTDYKVVLHLRSQQLVGPALGYVRSLKEISDILNLHCTIIGWTINQ